MSFNINSDKEKIRGSKPALIGDNEATIRVGTGSLEKEIIRTELDDTTGLPRVGINRTGQRVNNIDITNGGGGFTVQPTVTVEPPPGVGGIQAQASAFIFNGQVVTIAVNNPGLGYTTAPLVTIEGGGGSGATAEAVLDTVDYELDVSGAIRTSTSIISDTARILNLDIDNFVTPDANFRAPNLKTYQNNTGIPWAPNVILQKDAYRYFGANVYQSINSGQTGTEAPTHKDGIVLNGEVQFKHIGFHAVDSDRFGYNVTGDSGVFPRSITPLLGDRSDKIATTEYVLNLATNDVGGRIYVSQQIGSDLNDGRSAVNPVRTIKKACQEAWKTPGVKETIVVSGGDYVEDNPISIPPDASIVGDNLRLVIVRPANPGKHIFKFGDKNYVIGVTFRDQIDSNGDAVATWDYAMVFDDKQRIVVDPDVNGDAGVNFAVGTQVFGPDQFRVSFQQNTGLQNLTAGLEVVGLNTGARADIFDVSFTDTTGANAYINGTVDVNLSSGSFVEGERFEYITSAGAGSQIAATIEGTNGSNILKFTADPSSAIPAGTYVKLDDTNDQEFTEGFYQVVGINTDNAPTYWDVTFQPLKSLNAPTWNSNNAATIQMFAATPNVETIDTTKIKSIRAEGEVTEVDEDFISTLPISRIDFSLQGDPSIATGGYQSPQYGNAEDVGGIILYTNQLVGRTNTHEFKEGQEVEISGLPTNSPDLSFLNGKQRIYKVLEDNDGRCRRFVIPKKDPTLTDPNYDPGQFAVVKNASRVVYLSLLNSPNSFPLTTSVSRRFQDAANYIKNNRDFIADEVLGKVGAQFAKDYYSIFNIAGTAASNVTPTDATYDPATGDLVLTSAGHGLSAGAGVRIADSSLTFTCSMDSNATEHYYPKSTDPASGKALPITSVTTDTFTVNVGNAGVNSQYTPTNASYDPATGNLILTLGSHTLSVGDSVTIDDESLSFTCSMDGNQSTQNYPRASAGFSDLAAGKSIAITAADANSITVNVGTAGEDKKFTPSAATYNPATGDLTMTIGQHGIREGADIILANNSLSFRCEQDDYASTHTYPRPGTDPTAGSSVVVQSITKTQHTVTNASYTPATGEMVLTIVGHGFTNGDYVKLSDAALRFTCALDGNATNHDYPRPLDPIGDRWVKISGAATDTFQVNVGISSDTSTHAFVSAVTNGLERQTGDITINVGSTSIVNKDITNAVYTPASGVLTLTIGDHNLAVGDSVKIADNALTFTCGMDSNATNHTYPRPTDPAFDTSLEVVGVGLTQHTATGPEQSFSVTNATYSPSSGDMVLTIGSHSLTTSDTVRIKQNSLSFRCSMDGQTATKTYPRPGVDPQYDQEIAITATAATTITVNVGTTANVQHTATDGSYDPITGLMTLTIGAHSLAVGTSVKIADDSLTFQCQKDQYATDHAYPRSSDPARDTAVNITAVTATTITLDVGVSPDTSTHRWKPGFTATNAITSGGNYTHTWVGGTATNAVTFGGTYYNPTTGIMTLTIPGHGFSNGDRIKIDQKSLAFTCDLDNDFSTHSYPRVSDPAGDEWLVISNVATNSFTVDVGTSSNTSAHTFVSANANGISRQDGTIQVNVGSTPLSSYTPTASTYNPVTGVLSLTIGNHNLLGGSDYTATGAAYNPTTGVMTLTVANHGFHLGDRVMIADDSLTFECDEDSRSTQHTYPRATDPASGSWLDVTNITANTFDVQVLDSAPSTNVTTHYFISAVANGVRRAGDSIRIADDSLTFTCAQDGDATQHTYPRSTDPVYGTAVPVYTAGSTSHTIENATYTPETGNLELTITNHGFQNTNRVKIDTGSIVFTCTKDNNNTQHTYPRLTDPGADEWLEITNVTANKFSVNVGVSSNTSTHSFVSATTGGLKHQSGVIEVNVGKSPLKQWDVTDATYNPTTGFLVLTIGTHNLTTGTSIKIPNNALTFTCGMDGNSSNHTYPRSTDPYSDTSIAITGTTATTITVNVGTTPLLKYTPSNASYNPVNGELELTIGAHSLSTGESVKLAADSLTFTCGLDGNVTQKTYPRSSGEGANAGTPDPAYDTSITITGVTATTIKMNVGTSSDISGHTFISAATDALITGGEYTHTWAGGTASNAVVSGGNYAHNFVSATTGAIVTGGDYPHTFVSATAGALVIGGQYAHEFVSATSEAVQYLPQSSHTFIAAATNCIKNLPQSVHTFIRAATNAISIGGNTFKANIGVTPEPHTYVSGGTVEFGGSSYNISDFVYDNAVTGDATITLATSIPNIAEDDTVKLANILMSCAAGQKKYPAYSSPDASGADGDEQCREDTVHFLNALVRDLEFGTNHNIIEAGKKLIVDGKITYIDYEITQVVRSIFYAKELATYAMCNWRTGNRLPTDLQYAPEHSSVARYFDPTTRTATAGTPACDDVRAAIDTLALLYVDVISNNAADTYLDAAYLIARNRHLIADQALRDTLVQFPEANLSDVDERKCRRDINIVLSGLIRDLVLGGNSGIVTAAEEYFTGTQLTGIETKMLAQTIYAYQKVRDYSIDALSNWSAGTTLPAVVTPSTASYTPASGVLTVTFPTPGTAVTTSHRFAFTEEALTFTCDIDSDASTHAYPRRVPADVKAYGRSLEITNVSTSGGNTIVTVNVGPASGAAASSTHTFDSAKASGCYVIYDQVTTDSPIPKFEDWNITLYTGGTPRCANVASTINTEMALFEDILDETVASGDTTQTYGTLFDTSTIATYPDSYIYDANNQRVAIRGDFDDYPIIEASPYTQNSSVISFLGGSGALVDGAKVKQPNCPFAGLELDGSASFPNQGKSMVANAFTMVTFGGTGYNVINDGYAQLVSVFCIFAGDGCLASSGGYISITNSATNFGQFALRGVGYSAVPYTFDVSTITNVSSTPTGRTILTVSGLGREPLEHYVLKVDGYSNTVEAIEYFVDSVAAVTVGPPFSAQLTIDDGTGGGMNMTDDSTGNAVATSALLSQGLNLHRPSIVNSSSHTWEYAGSGTNYLALPENGGTKIEANEQVSENYGRVYVSGTDELGDFKVGTFARIENRTGNITFTGTVTISEVEFLKLKGGDVVVTGFDDSNTLGGSNASDSKLPTQKAVRDYITNNLGPYINKPYSTNAVPRALVELTDSGKISVDQIPALRPFSVYTVADQAERLGLEGALAGDIAIQQDSSQSFILNNDLTSLYLGFTPSASLAFTIGDIFAGSISNGQIQSTEYRKGVLYQINITNSGSGYTVAPTVTITGGNPEAGGVQAAATCTVANGQVVTVTIEEFNGFTGGKLYTTAPTITFAAPPGAGTQALGVGLIESRLYGDIVNKLKIEDTDTFDDSTTPTATTVNINRIVNTSATVANNWVSLSTNQIAASDITSGVIETDRLASGGAANSFTFLRGDQNFSLAVQSLKGAENRYFAQLYSQASTGTNQLIFQTNQNALVGHEVKSTNTGIDANTNITGVVTAGGLTTVSINNPVTQNIVAGTIMEFERGESPMTFESTYTQGNFIDDVIISNGGSGYTNGQYFGVGLSGGTGVDLKVNIVVSGNAVTDITVTDAGSGYNADFSITVAPSEIGTGSGLVLEAKVSTVIRQYANVAMDVKRVTDQTISSDLYGTIGVSRYKKAQFNIGIAGNGSVELKTGPDSGLDADLLDGAQGSFYLNSGNQNAGTLPTDRLSGTYNISISGQSQNTIRLLTGTNNPTSNPAPNNFVEGVISNTIFNSANSLADGGTRNLVMTIRNGGSGFDATYGGVRQLAFTDNDNMWLRGSGTGVTTWGSWGKVWTSLNDGVDSGLDADRFDNRQGAWYQNALNINFGTLSDNRLPRFLSPTVFNNTVTIKSFLGDPKYEIYVSGLILNTSPWIPGNPVNLYNSNSQAVGSFTIDNISINDDVGDNFNDYTILIGRLTSGNFIGAETIGTASQRVTFHDFTIQDANTYEIAKLYHNGGQALLNLGRSDGQATSPSIYFNSSASAASNYNVALIAQGGNTTDGSGTLDIQVVNADGLSINGNTAWNAGNIVFQSANIASTAVKRDASGNFSAGTITASIVGASSLNVLKTGDTMTGTLNITGAGSNLSVSNNLSVTGTTTLTDDLNVDAGSLYVDVSQNNVGIGTTSPSSAVKLDVRGSIRIGTFSQSQTNAGEAWIGRAADRQDGTLTIQLGGDSASGTKFEIVDRAWSKVMYSFSGEAPASAITVNSSGNVGFGRAATSGYKLDIDGAGMVQGSWSIDSANDNSGAPIYFKGASSARNFRIGNQIGWNDVFEITPSTANGNTTWQNTPAVAVQGTNRRVAINTNVFSGTDTTVSPNVNRDYQLNIQGDVNLNGQLFQNNAEFVTSRWTKSPNDNDIYRQSLVGINFSTDRDPEEALEVEGNIEISGQLEANGDKQWLDQYGVIKTNRNSVSENVTIPNNSNAFSFGPLEITSGNTVTIDNGGNWTIL